jgi:hypothetical protein
MAMGSLHDARPSIVSLLEFHAAWRRRAWHVRVLGRAKRPGNGAPLMRLRYYVLAILLVALGVLAVLDLVGSIPLIGAFPVSPIDGPAYLVSGVCAAFAARRGLGAMRMWGKILGVGYAAWAAAGFVLDGGGAAWLHAGVALIFLYHALLAPPTL